MLWPDDAEDQALAKLRRHIHSARKAFPPDGDPLRVDKLHVALNDGVLWCDVAAFENARKAGDLGTAVGLYAGPLLVDSLDDIVAAERDRLQTAFMTMVEELLRDARRLGDDDRAYELAAHMHQVDPWREDVVRTLMELRASSGDRSGALSLYDRFAKRLHEDIGVEPMPETVGLRDRLQAASPPALDGGRGYSVEVPFAGRSEELAALLAAANDVAAGASTLAFVCGEAGIGKSRLLRELSTQLTERGWRVAVGATSSGGERRAFQPLAEALGAFAERLHSLADAPRRIIDDLLSSATRAGDGATPRLVFDAIASAIGTLSEDRPLLLICEDAHDCDEATLDALLFAARRLQDAPVYFVTTYRSDEVGPAHPLMRRQRDLLAAGGATVLALERLGRDDVQHAVAGLVAERPSAAALAEEFFRISEGVPLVLQQVIQNWAESGERSPSQAAPVLGDLVASRTARLSDDARTLLEVAAIAGDAFDLEVVSAVAGLDAGAAFRCVDELLERRLLRENSSRFGSRLSFTHALIRTSIYDALPTVVRDRRHRRLGTIFAQMGADVVADAAFHLDAGGDYERAASAFLVAAHQFRANAAYERAAAHAERGIALARDTAVRFDLLLERESVADAEGDRARQRDLLARAADIAGDVGEPRVAELLARRARFARSVGDRSARHEALTTLGTLAQDTTSPNVRAGALFERGRTLYDEGEPALALSDFEQALALFHSAGDSYGAVEALVRMIEVAVTTGDAAQQDDLVARLRVVSAAADDANLRRRAEECAFSVALRRREYAEAERLGRLLLAMLERGRNRERLAYVHARLGIVMANSARWADARSHYARARRIYRELEDPTGLAIVALNEGTASARSGRLGDAEQQLAEADERFGDLDDHFGSTMVKSNRANVALHLGKYRDAVRFATEARDLAVTAGSSWLESVALGNLGAAKRALGDIAAALADAEAGIALLRASPNPGQLLVDLAEYGLTLLRAGRLDVAEAVMTELSALGAQNEAESVPYFPAYVEAAVAHAAGRPDAAELAALARSRLEAHLATLDPVGRDEMLESSFVRPVLELRDA
jgi:DNA-binding SARP family transcriptional activator